MSPGPDYFRTCKGCEALTSKEWAKRKVSYHCGHPGRCRGYMVGNPRLLPYIPAWCPKLAAEAKAKETIV